MPNRVLIDFEYGMLVALFPAESKHRLVRLAPNQSLRRGTLLAERKRSLGQYVAYQGAGHFDGTEIPKLILGMDCATDGSGIIHLATLIVNQSPLAKTVNTVTAYYEGTFACEQLVGLDESAVSGVNRIGRVVQGTLTRGIFRMG